MPRRVQIFCGWLNRAGLVLVAFILMNPFFTIMLANNSPSSRPNIKTRAGISTNWSGYAAVSSISSPANGFVNSVTGNWVIPTLTLNSSQNTYDATWVGIDGFSDGTVEQIGTEQDCVNGIQENYAWVEFYPRPSRIITGLTVNNGDAFTASVAYEGGSLFALSITDLTTRQSYSRAYSAVAQRQSAEWVVEAPSLSAEVLPLANFGTVNFSSAQFTDNTGTTYAIDGQGPGTYDAIALDDPNGGSAKPSGLLDSAYPNGPSSFSVAYAAPVNIHDVALTSVTPSKTLVGQGYSLDTIVIAADLGSYPETFNVTLYANTAPITSLNATLSAGNSTNITLSWNTTGVVYSNYTISAYALPVSDETNTTNNNCTDGLVTVSIPGDLNGDFKVSLSDLAIFAHAYGSKPNSANWNPNADMDDSGTVGLSDLVILAKHYGQHT
ncbi:MAG: G1 family glutamic endopeptidase [Candidatus Bathyarchaeia archaeon]